MHIITYSVPLIRSLISFQYLQKFEMELNLCSKASPSLEQEQKEILKIHPLGNPSAKNRTLNNVAYRVFPSNYKSYCRSITISQPVSFCSPQVDLTHLVKQLEELKDKYSNLEKNVQQTSIYEKKICEDVEVMTKNFQLQLSQVVHENKTERQNDNELQELKCIHISNCDNMLDTLREASDKMAHLEADNQRLSHQLQQEKQKNSKIVKENQFLWEKLKNIENGKQNIIKGIKGELEKLSDLRIKESDYSALSQNNHQ